jgi:two-component system cell cycle response regulator DivK
MNLKRVTVVEDNKINSKLFADLLELNGILATPILDGDRAFEAILRDPPDLVIMDIQLQNISGIDVVKLIRAEPSIKHLPIIAVTAFASNRDEKRIIAAGCNAYMSKPISIDAFMVLVRKLLPV